MIIMRYKVIIITKVEIITQKAKKNDKNNYDINWSNECDKMSTWDTKS